MNKYLSYSFLYDPPGDLRCDFEILTDEISSMIGFLRSLTDDDIIREDLCKLNELIYHVNPTLRKRTAITAEELEWLLGRTKKMQAEIQDSFTAAAPKTNLPRFVVPQGCSAAAYSHIIRNKCKAAVRLLYRHQQQGNRVDDIVFDFINLSSGYFFSLALKLNKDQGVEEKEFLSRVYT
ncbi:MAG: ATP--cob(I)alamin adenosyltransferase [Treponema sp.]|jgi:ATP:cob(I)alamin adenosyltransferase|nr:ATP--cob(I)alamin adenosyltransferase [Treponema sp.]